MSQPPPGPPPGPSPPSGPWGAPAPTPGWTPQPQTQPQPGWGGYPAGGYGAGGYPGSYPTRQKTSGLAVASLVTGLLFWCFVIPGIVAVVLGHLALEQIEDSAGAKTGRGLAIAGIILGWIGIGILGIVAAGWVITLLGT